MFNYRCVYVCLTIDACVCGSHLRRWLPDVVWKNHCGGWLSFKTQLKIEYLLPYTGSRKVLENNPKKHNPKIYDVFSIGFGVTSVDSFCRKCSWWFKVARRPPSFFTANWSPYVISVPWSVVILPPNERSIASPAQISHFLISVLWT